MLTEYRFREELTPFDMEGVIISSEADEAYRELKRSLTAQIVVGKAITLEYGVDNRAGDDSDARQAISELDALLSSPPR